MIEYELITTVQEVVDILPRIDKDIPLYIDIETEGLFINLVTIAVYQEHWEKPVVVLDDGVCATVLLANIEDCWWVAHNATYELGTLRMSPRAIDDTMLLAGYAYPEWRERSLDVVTEKLTTFKGIYATMDKKVIRKKFKKGVVPEKQLLEYAALDVLVMPQIFNDNRIQLAREITAYKVNMQSLLYSAEYQRNGLRADMRAVQKELDLLAPKLDDITRALGGLNFNSPLQVKKALGSDSTSKDALIEIITSSSTNKEKLATAKNVYDGRRLYKRRGLLESYYHNKVYTFFNPYGTATGRFSATGGDLDIGINSQQIPRDLQYLFEFADDETSVIHADFSTAELRAATSIMKEPVMYGELRQNIDLHKAAASMARGIPVDLVTKAQRQEGKAISFGLIFGMSAPKFVQYAYTNYGVAFTLEEARVITRRYAGKYKAINAYQQYWYKHVDKVPVESALGHRAFAGRGTEAINFATQATIAETTKLSVHYLIKEFPETIIYIFNVVHDAIYLRVPVGKEEYYKQALYDSMQKGWKNICNSSLMYYKDIPMPVDIEVVTKESYNKKLQEKHQ